MDKKPSPNLFISRKIDSLRSFRADLKVADWQLYILEPQENTDNLSANSKVRKKNHEVRIGLTDWLGLQTYLENLDLADFYNDCQERMEKLFISRERELKGPRKELRF